MLHLLCMLVVHQVQRHVPRVSRMLLAHIPNNGIPPVFDYPYNMLLVQNTNGKPSDHSCLFCLASVYSIFFIYYVFRISHPHWEILDIKSGTQEFNSRLHCTNSPSLCLHPSEMRYLVLDIYKCSWRVGCRQFKNMCLRQAHPENGGFSFMLPRIENHSPAT